MVDTRKITTSILLVSASVPRDFSKTHRVVKFIVKVKLIEKRVKSAAGSVYETQYKRVGSKPRLESTMRPNTVKIDDGVLSAAFIATIDVWTASGNCERASAEDCPNDVTASGATMAPTKSRGGDSSSCTRSRGTLSTAATTLWRRT